VACKHRLPGFRTSCLVAGALYVVIGGAVLARGTAASMGEFGVPADTLASPHYDDAIRWVYLHMVVLGLVLGVVGHFGQGVALQRWFARLMLAAHVAYVFLDVRGSDTALGTGLYQGPASIIPAVCGGFVLLLFAHLSICRRAEG
jgi:hypothetical protein